MANARIEDFNFKNEKSQVKNFYNFQLFVTFSPDSDSSAIKFFRTGSKYAYIFIKKNAKIPDLSEKKKKLNKW